MYRYFLKRVMDFLMALVALVLLAPLLLIVIVILYFQNDGKPFFLQERPGKNQEPFQIIKFKTMTDARDADGNLLADKDRITWVGNLLRKLSIDELPQLVNVLLGDMSLVGPRPLLFRYVPLYNSEQIRRHEVKPGITGWAQVNGRNSITWSEKFRKDVYYVDHLSFVLDIRILLLTVLKVVRREGVNQSAERPMVPFNGNN